MCGNAPTVVCLRSVCIFFFKQKTAYEMRISDWSSDVCSSDLGNMDVRPPAMASDGNEIAHNLVALAGGDEPSALVAERRFLSLRTREICGLARPFARRGEIALSQGIGNVTGRRCLKIGRAHV